MTPKYSAGSDEKAIKVIYIVGWGRSGSTLLDNVLGQMDGCLSCGELRYVWRRGVVENRLCGDGIAFKAHPFWSRVMERAFGDRDLSLMASDMLGRERRILRAATMLPRLAFRLQPAMNVEAEPYVAALGSFYQAIAEVSGCQYVVDSSKNPVYAYWLSQTPGIDLRVVHLIRDPRAVAYSWLRKKAQPDKGGMMERHNTLRSILHWRLANSAAEFIEARCGSAYLRLRYEDFVAEPRQSIGLLAGRLRLGGSPAPFHADESIDLKPNCAFSGNPARFRTGAIHLTVDDEWRRNMPVWRRVIVEALAGPALSRYGYT